MKSRLAVAALVVGFLAGPALSAVASGTCGPCCAQAPTPPCETGQTPCESMVAIPCCEAPPAAPVSFAKRSLEGPAVGFAPAALRSEATPPAATSLRTASELAARTSPLRLSVVLRI